MKKLMIILVLGIVSCTPDDGDPTVFCDNSTSDFQTPSATINLVAGTSYTIKRIQTNWGNNIGNTIGRLATTNTMSFPYTYGIMTITGSNFHQNGGPAIDFGVPYIDIIFK